MTTLRASSRHYGGSLSVANEVGPTAFQSGPFEVYVTQLGLMRRVTVQRGATDDLAKIKMRTPGAGRASEPPAPVDERANEDYPRRLSPPVARQPVGRLAWQRTVISCDASRWPRRRNAPDHLALGDAEGLLCWCRFAGKPGSDQDVAMSTQNAHSTRTSWASSAVSYGWAVSGRGSVCPKPSRARTLIVRLPMRRRSSASSPASNSSSSSSIDSTTDIGNKECGETKPSPPMIAQASHPDTFGPVRCGCRTQNPLLVSGSACQP